MEQDDSCWEDGLTPLYCCLDQRGWDILRDWHAAATSWAPEGNLTIDSWTLASGARGGAPRQLCRRRQKRRRHASEATLSKMKQSTVDYCL